MFDKQKLILDSKDLICRSGLENTLHIAFAADENYAKHIGVVIFSVLQNNPHLDLHFHLFVDELSASEEKRILALQPLHSRFSVSVYYLDSSVFGSLQTCEHFSKAMYYRMAIPNVL